MTSHYTSRSKLRVLRSSHRKNPFYELPPPTRKPMPVVIKSEFPEFADNQTLDEISSNEHANRIKPDPSSPTLLSYNNDIIYNGYWLRNNTKKKSYCESSSSSPEMIFKRLRRNSVEVEKYCNSTKRRRSVKTDTLDEEEDDTCLISDKQTLHSNKSENNLARNEIGVMEKPGNIRNFRRNFKFNSNNLVTSIKQESVESRECNARAKRVRSLSDVSSVKTHLITNFKQEPSETITNTLSEKNSEIGLNFKCVSDISSVQDETNSTSNQSPTILTCNNQLTPVNKSKKYRDFKKKLDFGQDTTSSDFTKIEYDEENIRALDNTKNDTIKRLELNSSKDNSFMIEIKSSDSSDRNFEAMSTSPEVICIGEPDGLKIVTEVTIDDHSADKNSCPILLSDEYNTENSNLSIVFTVPAEENKTNTHHEKGWDIIELSRELQNNSEFHDFNNIEPSINTLLDSKMLTFLINDSSQDSPPLNLKNFRTPGNSTNRDSVVPNSDESLCSSPEESILEINNISKLNLQNQKSYTGTKVIGISSNFLGSEINNNYSESPIEDMSLKYNKFSKKMDQILFELTDEKLLPLVNQKNNYYNFEFSFSREQELELDLINEIIEEDLEKEKNCINDESESAKLFENSKNDGLKFNDTIQCPYDPCNDESANLLPTTFGPEVSSASNLLGRKMSHEEFINNKNEVSETGNINNECLELINNDSKASGQMLNTKNSIDTNFCEKNLSNCSEMSEIDRTISKSTDNKTVGIVSLEQTILYPKSDSTFPESDMLIVEHTTKDTNAIIEENNCPEDTISTTRNTSFFCEEILDNSNDLSELKNSDPKTSSSKEPEVVCTEGTILCPELVVSRNFPDYKTIEKQFDCSSVFIDRNQSQVYNIDERVQATNNTFLSNYEEVQAHNTRTTEQLRVNRDLFESVKMSNFEHESFATAFACSLQSLYQFDRECVSPIILSKNTSTESETSDEFVLTTIGDYVSPIPSDIEESFYLSPTIRELDMKPYAKYFDTEKIRNAEDPELEFSKQLGKCKAIDNAITSDYRKRQRLGEIAPDARWQTSIIKRLRAQQRKFDRDLKRRKDSKKRKSEDKNSNFVEVKSTKSKAIALKKTDVIFKNQKLNSIPSSCSSIRIGRNSKELTQLVSNVDKIVGKRSVDCDKIKESGVISSLVELQCELNGITSENSCDRNSNLKVPFQKTEIKHSIDTSNSDKVEASCAKIVPISSYVFPDPTQVITVPNEKTDVKQCTKKSISTFKIPFKRPPCNLVSSEEKKSFVPKTDKPKKYAPPYSLLKKPVDKKLESISLEKITKDDKMQKYSQKWMELKKEIKKRNPSINIDGAISLLGKTEIAKRNAAFEAMAKTVESQMKALKSSELKDRVPKTGTISQPSVKNEEMKNIPNVLNMVNVLNTGRNFIGGDTKTMYNQSWSEHLNKTVEQETKTLVQPTHDINTSKLLLSLLSTRKDLLWQNCSVLLRYGDWSGNCEAKKTMMDAMSTIPVDSAAILNSVATIKSIFKSSRSENKRVAEAANTLLLKMGTVEEILPFLFMNN